MMWEKREEYYRKYSNFWNVGSHLGANCLRAFAFFATFFQAGFRNLWGGTRWTDLGLPWGTLGPILTICWKILGANLLQISKIPEQQIAPTTPSEKQARTNEHFTDI